MSPRHTAHERLERILYILPAAARQGGATLAELARALETDVATIIADIEHVTAREYYHPGGTVDQLRLVLTGQRVEVHAAAEFRRPVRLNPREALALTLGLRVLAAEAEAARYARIVALAERLETELVVPPLPVADMRPPQTWPGARFAQPADDEAPPVEPSLDYDADEAAEVYLDLGADDARGVLADAIETQRRCTIHYLKPGDVAPTERRIEPYTLVYFEYWFVIARDSARNALRVFRLDRVLHVHIEDDDFEAPADFDPAAFFADGVGPFLAEHDAQVTVRYSPNIARWIAERTARAPERDGSIVVQHRVADPRWIVRHVLQYAGDAVIEDDREYRRLVRESAARLAS
jgi:predicted DNA-binding transcriptional regulator YafY